MTPAEINRRWQISLTTNPVPACPVCGSGRPHGLYLMNERMGGDIAAMPPAVMVELYTEGRRLDDLHGWETPGLLQRLRRFLRL